MMTWFQYRDPLLGVLDYIAEVRRSGHDCSHLMNLAGPKKKCPADTIAIAHDDDLQLIENVVSPKSKC